MDTVKELREFVFDEEKSSDEKINILYSIFKDKYMKIRLKQEKGYTTIEGLEIGQKVCVMLAFCSVFSKEKTKTFDICKNILDIAYKHNHEEKRKITDEESLWIYMILKAYQISKF